MEQYDEKKLIKELCAGNIPEERVFGKISQYKVLGLLCMHRCAEIAYYHLWKNQKLFMLNREMQTTLQALYENGFRKDKSVWSSLAYLEKLFRGVDFRYALLKGAKLIEFYPAGTRTSNDIDILIERASIPKVAKILTDNGFSQGYIRNNVFVQADRKDIINALLNRGETTPFVKEVNLDGKKFLEIDVNISVDEQSNGRAEVVKEMLVHTLPDIKISEGKCLYTLDKVDFLIHLCTHLYKEASIYQWVEMGRDLSLYKFLDISIYWKACMREDLLPVLRERMERYNVQEAVCYALYGTNCLWKFESIGLARLFEERKDIIEKVMDYVYDPAKKQRYRYSDSLEERIFDEQHKKHLTAV